MNTENYTIAIYGIQDINGEKFPNIVHDHSIAIYKDGKIKKFIQLERLTRKKYDNSLSFFLYDILKKEDLFKNDNYDLIFVDNILGNAFISKEGNLRFEGNFHKQLSEYHHTGRAYWLNKEIEAYVLNHELAHIYSCVPFYGNFIENSLLVHFDGGASKSNFSAWIFKNGKLKLIEYHWDFKYLSSFFNSNALVFSIIKGNLKNQHSVPGKFMGYAAYGNYSENIESWLKENDFFSNIWGKKNYFFKKVKTDWNFDLNSFDLKNSFIQDIAATFHHIFIRDIINKINKLKEKTNTEYLYFSGGSALNISLNTVLVNKNIFKNIFIPPCTNDSGLAIGAGVYLEILKGNNIYKHNAYLNNLRVSSQYTCSLYEIKKVASLLMKGELIGICNGNGEAGPRALGNRSIVALANSKKLAVKVSEKIKKREWYRPVAPVMLEHNTKLYTGLSVIHHLSKFMLLEFNILPEYRTELQGVVHINGTSRIQTIFNKEDNPYMYDLLSYMESQYGIKALINTSFNRNNEPLVHTNEDAKNAAIDMKLDGLVYNGKLIEL